MRLVEFSNPPMPYIRHFRLAAMPARYSPARTYCIADNPRDFSLWTSSPVSSLYSSTYGVLNITKAVVMPFGSKVANLLRRHRPSAHPISSPFCLHDVSVIPPLIFIVNRFTQNYRYFGRRGRTRTYECRNQNPMPCRLATRLWRAGL